MPERGAQMTIVFEAPAIPLQIDEDGVIRVGSTRVTLTTLVHAFEQGHTPEEIVTDFPALQLPDVYAVITYYLNNREMVKSYLAEQDREGDRIRTLVEARTDFREFRMRLLARAEANRTTVAK